MMSVGYEAKKNSKLKPQFIPDIESNIYIRTPTANHSIH